MSVALQAPASTTTAVELSRRLWRKPVLKKGTIDYDGRQLVFDDNYVHDLVNAFNQGAYDQVAFQLATDDNRHTDDPERTRGEIKAFVATPSGMDAIIETGDRGSEIIHDNPRLGVSCRIIEGLEKDGRSFRRAVKHVLGTLDPRLSGMGEWQPADLSTPDSPVVDLTNAPYQEDRPMPISDDQRAAFDAYVNELAQFNSGDGPEAAQPAAAAPKGDKADETLDDELQAVLEALGGEEQPEPEPAAASLSNSADPDPVDLARAEADQAKQMAVQMRHELWAQRADAEKERWVSAGLDPATWDLAAPALYGDDHVDDQAIDLAGNTRQVNHSDIVRKLLELVPKVDLSAEHGYAVPPRSGGGGGSRTNADELLDLWAKQMERGGIKS